MGWSSEVATPNMRQLSVRARAVQAAFFPGRGSPPSDSRNENLLGEAAEAEKMAIRPAAFACDAKAGTMDNLAPAIAPPDGMGESKPTNPAVLDWVQEV